MEQSIKEMDDRNGRRQTDGGTKTMTMTVSGVAKDGTARGPSSVSP